MRSFRTPAARVTPISPPIEVPTPSGLIDAVGFQHGQRGLAEDAVGIIRRGVPGPARQASAQRVGADHEIGVGERLGRLVEIAPRARQPVPHDQRRLGTVSPLGHVHLEAGDRNVAGSRSVHLRPPRPISVPAMPAGKK